VYFSTKIVEKSFRQITIGKNTYESDMYILVNGEIKRRAKKLAKEIYGTSHKIGPSELKNICRGKPKKVFIGTGQSGVVELTQEGDNFLREHGVECCVLPTSKVIQEFNKFGKPKAAVINLSC
jgi:hypothetical protein